MLEKLRFADMMGTGWCSLRLDDERLRQGKRRDRTAIIWCLEASKHESARINRFVHISWRSDYISARAGDHGRLDIALAL